MKHRFAAILAADVVRFSGRMETDSEATVRALQECRDVFRHCVSRHHGREFGSVGDSLMAEFASPVEALRAAREFQAQIDVTNAGAAERDRLELRIGLHAGDVVAEGDDLFGDVVNTAARLQSLARIGGIAMSGFFHTQVHKEAGFQFRALGTHHLKNIAEPVAVFEVASRQRAFNWRRTKLALAPYRVALAATMGVMVAGALLIAYLEVRESPGIGGTVDVVDAGISGGESLDTMPSIAVLPFLNLSDDPGNEYFSDGVSEELLNTLARIAGLRVISRSSAFFYKDKNAPITEIARQLKVAHIVEGSVRRTGDRVRITAQLIDAGSDAHVWSRTFDRELDDIFAVQQEIAEAIADALELRLVTASVKAEQTPMQGTTSPEAYDLYLRARESRRKGDYSGRQDAVRLLERALRLDNDFALAHAWLASTFVSMQEGLGYSGRLSKDEALRRATPHLERAEELDPNLHMVHLVRAHLAFNQDKRESVIEHARKALAINPSSIGSMNVLAIALQDLSRYEEMLEVYQKMLATDPLSIVARVNYSGWLCEMGRIDEGREMARSILAQNLGWGYRKLGEVAFHYDGRIAEAVAWFLKAHAERGEDTRVNALLVDALIGLGEYDEARRIDDLMIPRVDLAQGRFDAAIGATQAKLRRDPQNPAAIIAAADALYLSGRINEALPLYERLRDFTPEGVPVAFNWWPTMRLAVARRHTGDEEGAWIAAESLRKDVTLYREAIGESSGVARADALLAAFGGDTDGVIDALERTIRARNRELSLLADPVFEPWWSDERVVALQQELDKRLSQEHDKFLRLVCLENPVPDVWRPLPETCAGVIERSSS